MPPSRGRCAAYPLAPVVAVQLPVSVTFKDSKLFVLLGNRSCLVMSGPFPAAHAAAKGYALVTIYGPWRCGMRHRVTLETS